MAFELSMHSDRRWELLGSCVGLPYAFLESSCCLGLSDHRHCDSATRRSIQVTIKNVIKVMSGIK